MTLDFPENFVWGTSTSSGQIERASDHNFSNFNARDGHILNRTTDHEKQRIADVDHIARFGSLYRCSIDWARLQKAPHAAFDKAVVAEYCDFFEALNGRGMKVMLVLHHFSHPSWFEKVGGWVWESNLESFYDYCARCVKAFGKYVYAWNTFNEPNVYALNAYYLGVWPPFQKGLTKASRVLGHMAQAHEYVYKKLKESLPNAQVGYSLCTAFTEGKGFRGQASAKMFDWWFYSRPIKLFQPVDFVGISYFSHLIFAPSPLTALENHAEVERLGLLHDDMWVLKPEGLAHAIQRVHKDTGLPVWVMENGVCTSDPYFRIEMLQQYLQSVYSCLRENIPVLGYTHKSIWDCFEWHLGLEYNYGLMQLDLASLKRINTPAADWYEEICRTNSIPA